MRDVIPLFLFVLRYQGVAIVMSDFVTTCWAEWVPILRMIEWWKWTTSSIVGFEISVRHLVILDDKGDSHC